jgi:ABC-2 type transport system permease protein
MTLTTSSNKKLREFREIYLWSLKKVRGMSVLLALLIFMALPMILMISLNSNKNYIGLDDPYKRLVSTYSSIVVTMSIMSMVIALVFTAVISVMLFNYLHQKRSVDLFHSLPLGRVPMLLGRYCAGLTALLLPVLVNYVVVCIVGFSYGIDVEHSFTFVAIKMLWFLLMLIAAMTFSVFMAICTGTSFDMMISILGVNAAYPLLILVGAEFTTRLLPGFSTDFSASSTLLTALAPFVAAVLPISTSDGNPASADFVTGGFLLWWILFTLFLLAASVWLYQKRKSESAESSFAFPIPKIVIRFLITAVAGIGFGLVLMLSADRPSNFFIGLVTGSLAAHIIVEAVYSRGFKQMKKSFSWYAVFALAFLVFYGVLATGCFGYDTRVPSADEVQSITFEEIPREYYEYPDNTPIYSADDFRLLAKITPKIQTTENIDKVLSLHKALTEENRKSFFPYPINMKIGNGITVTYHLKDGGILKRTYPETEPDLWKSKIQNMAQQITEIKEFRETASILTYLEPEYIQSFAFSYGSDKPNEPAIIPDAKAKEELLEAIKQDYLSGKAYVEEVPEGQLEGVILEFETPITIKDGKLKDFLNGYDGEVILNGSNYISLKGGAEQTQKVIDKYGWK